MQTTRSSLSGTLATVYPLASISTCGFGYRKPISYFVLATLFFLATIVGFIVLLVDECDPSMFALLLISLTLSVVCALLYYLRKTLYIFAFSHAKIGVHFLTKCSIIEGVNISEDDAERIAIIITDLIERNQMNKQG